MVWFLLFIANITFLIVKSGLGLLWSFLEALIVSIKLLDSFIYLNKINQTLQMTDLLYHHVKIKEGEPGYKKGELLYHYVKIEDKQDNSKIKEGNLEEKIN